ncbi:malto-oligosyltrehalose synthase [Uliginosibacterium sp. H3]|uniref:Malto-oligosyltrehalose synthase n=1 Tax=Uliginosibacterium silvisoli TaxID=3114758 RepID=A0ABU6K1C3_9RHOO|nr:malto-oligosyltrehalose synthase [Uliginosibacterium sp. H3]
MSNGSRAAQLQQAKVPLATYRVQLHSQFHFTDAMDIVPYLAGLGITHLYISPPLRARAGSQHGYDVVDHGTLNPELGTREDFDRLVACLHAHQMGLLIDIVPNHMGVLSDDNAWWLDILENGAASAYAGFFDIDWRSADPALTGKVLLPILGDQYGIVLERGELQLGFDAAHGSFSVHYYAHRLPIDPLCYGALLREAARQFNTFSGDAAQDVLMRLATQFEQLPHHTTADSSERLRRQTDKTHLKAALATALREQPALAGAIDRMLGQINGTPGERKSFDRLSNLIDAQAYRLAYWRIASDEINYRRFFDVNELAALRMERDEVFEATHKLVLDLLACGAVDGLRVDHPDGMADPAGYFARLQQRYAEVCGLPAPAPASAGRPPDMPLYVVAEKIVALSEEVPAEWAVHGTTGYRFANLINGLLLDGDAKNRLDRAWRAFVRDEAEDFETLARQCKHVVMDSSLAGELTLLSVNLLRLAREDRRTRDFTFNSLRQALSEVVASFPVYRTYIVDTPSRQDRKFINWAIGSARRRSVAGDASAFDFLHRVLLGAPPAGASPGLGERYRAFARRLQQYTAPVTAKGVEDTALYRHHRLVSVNDVGGDPDVFGISVANFHAVVLDRSLKLPHTMLATSTHDAKRVEDVRMRINVISEMPAAWRLGVRRWSRMNRSHKRIVNGQRAPTRNDEYLLYQLIVGSLPAGELSDDELLAYARRIEQAMLKSARESKIITSWMSPNPLYEAALTSFVHILLQARDSNLFLSDIRRSTSVFAWHGAMNSLSLAVVKTLSPGVPDFYQGHEAMEFSLVDPDNRRPVDYDLRRGMLAEAQTIAALPDQSAALQALLREAQDGRAKFWTVWRSLQLRREHADMLRHSRYVALEVRGQYARNVIAFARHTDTQWLIVVATRLSASLGVPAGEAPVGSIWGDTHIILPAAMQLVDTISGQRHACASDSTAGNLLLAEVLRHFPVAALSGSIEPFGTDT